MTGQTAPSIADIEQLARRALAGLPASFKAHLGDILIRVEDFPDAETERAMRLENPFDLLGLYRGVALPLKSVSDPLPRTDMIFLYRRPILEYWCDSGDELFAIVHHVLVHEIGHHFGFSDADMERIEHSE